MEKYVYSKDSSRLRDHCSMNNLWFQHSDACVFTSQRCGELQPGS